MVLPRSTFFKALVAAKPSSIAIATPSTTYTYSELLRSVASVQKSLESVKSGDRVAILCEKGIGYAAAFLGIWAAGGVAVPVCTSHPVPEIMYTLSDSGSKILIYSKKFEQQQGELQKKITELRTIDVDKTEHGSEPELAKEEFDHNSNALFIYTSGTTGQPKGAIHTHKSTQAQMSSLKEAWKYSSDDRLLHVLPLHHIHGIVNAFLTPLYAQGTVEFADEKFDAQTVWSRLSQTTDPITLFMAVPTIYTKLLASVPASTKLDGVRLCVSGSAALPSSVKDKWHALTGHTLLERYGMTEIGMGLSCGLADSDRLDSSVGWPMPGISAKLVSEDGSEVTEPDVTGEIWIAGDHLFKEYHGRPEQTASEIVVDGGTRWFKTGDVALKNVRGAYFIQGRSSVDIIKSGGYKISALEIERDLLTLPYVKECAVIGIKDEEWGQRVAALIVPSENEEVTLTRVRNDLKKQIASYKVPTIVRTVSELKRNAMGKINKKELVRDFEL